MSFNISRNEGEMTFSPLNKTSDKVMMDTLVVFKPNDYCPLFDDDFDPQKSSPFLGEVYSKPYNVSEVTICEDYFLDEFQEKLYEITGVDEPSSWMEKEAALQVLEDANYLLVPIHGKAVEAKDGKLNVNYSLTQEEGMAQHGFALIEATSSPSIAQMFVDRANGKDISLHALKVYPNDKIPIEHPFMPVDNMEVRDKQIFDFLDNNGTFVPEKELDYHFKLASILDLTEQVKAGKDFDHLPEEARTSLPLSKIVIANHPQDLEKTKVDINVSFLDGVVGKMSLREHNNELKEDSIKLLQEIDKVDSKLIPIIAANLIKHNCMTCKDLPANLRENREIYANLIKSNPDLLNVGISGGAKLEDIPTNILQSQEIVNLIADQMVFKSYFMKPHDIVFYEALPSSLQKNPVILGRELSQNTSLLSQISPQVKGNPEFLNSLFKTLSKEQFPEVFNQLYGGVRNAPMEAKEAAISTIKLSPIDVRPILEASFGKHEVDKMIARGQEIAFGNEKGFTPNLTGEGYKHLLSAEVKMNALGEIRELRMNFDNGYVEPDGDHGGWQSKRSHVIDSFDAPALIQVPLNGHENVKKEISLALGGVDAPKAWMPTHKDAVLNKDVYKHLSNDDRSARG